LKRTVASIIVGVLLLSVFCLFGGSVSGEQPTIPASVGISPEPMNLKSNGKLITACIELPEGYNVAEIDVSTVKLNDTIPVDLSVPPTIGDYDNDGVPDLTVKFNRTAISEYILSRGIKYGEVTLTATGKLNDETMFEGNSVIRVRMPGDASCDGKVDVKDVMIVVMVFGTSAGVPSWNRLADLNEDGKVDVRDVGLVCANYGKIYA
jgi:hypothetical protein